MNCFEEACDGIYRWKEIGFTIELNNGNTITVKKLRVQQCTVCGEQIFDSAASKQIEDTITEKYPDYYKKYNKNGGFKKVAIQID